MRAITVVCWAMTQLTDAITVTGRGKVTTVSFESFEQIEARFQREWNRLVKEVTRAQD